MFQQPESLQTRSCTIALSVFLVALVAAPAQARREPRNAATQPESPVVLTPVLQLNVPVSESLDDENPRRSFTLTLNEPTFIEITQASDEVDSYLRLLDEEGSEIAVSDDEGGGLNSRIFQQLDAGTWQIVAGSYNDGSVGTFTLAAREWTPDPILEALLATDANTEISLAPGAETFAPIVLHWDVESFDPQLITVDLPDGTFRLQWMGPDGAILADQTHGAGTHSIRITPDWVGQHRLIVTTHSLTAASRLTIQPPVALTPPPVLALTPGEHQLEFDTSHIPTFGSGFERQFRLDVPNGYQAVATLSSQLVQTRLRVADVSRPGRDWVVDDGTGTLVDSAIGQQVLVSVGSAVAGPFSLTVRFERSAPTTIPVWRLGQNYSGTWSDEPLTANLQNRVAVGTINATTAPMRVSGECDRLLAIRPTGETVVLASTGCSASFQPDIAGPWTLVLVGPTDAAGRWQVRVDPAPTDALPTLVTTPHWVSETFGHDMPDHPSRDAWARELRLELTDTAEITVGAGGAPGVDTLVEVLRDGQVVASNDDYAGLDSLLQQVMPPGEYTVRLSQYARAIGGFKAWILTDETPAWPGLGMLAGQSRDFSFAANATVLPDSDVQGVRVQVVVPEDGVYRISVVGSDFDPVLFVHDAAGVLLAENDDREPGDLNSEVLLPLRAGTCTLEIHSYDGSAGSGIVQVIAATSSQPRPDTSTP